MKTLQEQYNRIAQGKGNKEIFTKHAKRQFPNLIRNAAGFDETCNALISRDIISSAYLNLTNLTENTQPNFFDTFNKNMSLLNEEAKAVEKKVSKEVEDVQKDKGFDYKETNQDYGQSSMHGYHVECCDPKNVDKTVQEIKDIVAKNLAKDRLHYIKDGQFGVKGLGYTDEHPGLTASKSDQMEKVKIKENMIKLTDLIVEALEEKTPKKKKEKKPTTEDKLKEIEAQGRVNTLEQQIAALEEIIETKNDRLRLVDEDENMSDLADRKKIKLMEKEVKLLEKQKEKYMKLYEKACGTKYRGVIDEDPIQEDNYEDNVQEDNVQEDNYGDTDIKENNYGGYNRAY